MSLQRTVVLVASSLVTALIACSSGSSSSSGSTSSGASGATSSGATSSGAASSSGASSSGGRGVTGCPSTGSTCTQAEQDTYSKCLTDTCDTEYKACLGSDYKNGTFGGSCGTYISCTNACSCNDTACTQKCKPDQACQDCLLKTLSPCTQKCAPPKCATGGTSSSGSTSSGSTSSSSGSSGKTCADLATCCAKIADADTKSSCDQVVATKQDASCGAVYPSFEASCQ